MPQRILLTGASSFTGCWFALDAAKRGYEVIAPLARSQAGFHGDRADRVAKVARVAEVVYDAPCGSARLRQVAEAQESLDAVCVHHAVVGDYRSSTFDVPAAVAAATAGARELLVAAVSRGATSALLTRSVFESGQGLSDDPRPIGLYAVAKTATVDLWASVARSIGMSTAEFTITNPFGLLEEPRFVAYLAKTWWAGGVPKLRAPDWVRDNVPVPLLAAAYTTFLQQLLLGHAARTTPSHLVATNLDYARRLGDEFAPRWGIPCGVGVADSRDIDEPRVRIGTDLVDWSTAGEAGLFWDAYVEYYAERQGSAGMREKL